MNRPSMLSLQHIYVAVATLILQSGAADTAEAGMILLNAYS